MQLEDDSAPSDRDQAGRISGAIFVAIRVRIAMRVERLIDRRVVNHARPLRKRIHERNFTAEFFTGAGRSRPG